MGHAGESRDDFFNHLEIQPNVDRISSKAAKQLLAKRIALSTRKLPELGWKKTANSG